METREVGDEIFIDEKGFVYMALSAVAFNEIWNQIPPSSRYLTESTPPGQAGMKVIRFCGSFLCQLGVGAKTAREFRKICTDAGLKPTGAFVTGMGIA